MSITNQQSSVQYTLSAANQTVAYPFRILSDADVTITRTRSGASLVLTIGTDYSVSGVNLDAGGSVTFTGTDTAIGDVVLIERFTEVTQEATYVTNGKFPAAVQEYGLDKLTLIAIDSDRRIGIVESGLTEIQEDITSIDASVEAAATSAAAALVSETAAEQSATEAAASAASIVPDNFALAIDLTAETASRIAAEIQNTYVAAKYPWPMSGAFYAFGDSYTWGANNGVQLPANERYANVCASLFSGTSTVTNKGIPGTCLGWNASASYPSQDYLVASAFHSLGFLPTSWTGVATFMAGFNDTPTGSTPSNLTDGFWDQFREGTRAAIARMLFDGWSGVSIYGVGNTGDATTTPTGWATSVASNENLFPSALGTDYMVFNFRETVDNIPARLRVSMSNANDYITFQVSDKRAVGLMLETDASGGSYTVSVNGTVVGTYSNFWNTNTTTFGVNVYPQCVWLESLPATATIRIDRVSGAVKWLGFGWVNNTSSLVTNKLLVIGSLANNTAAHSTAVLDRAALEISAAIGSFTPLGYPVLYANSYSAITSADADPVDTNHLTVAGYSNLGKAFRNAQPASAAYSPFGVNLENGPKVFRKTLHTSGTGTDIVAAFRQDGDTFDRIQIRADGLMLFGSGSSAVSCALSLINPGEISISGLFSDFFRGTLAGNASTATALATAQTINGVSFNGTANITVPGKSVPVTVATLPASPAAGDWAAVTDALAPTYGATVVGGGAIVTPVWYDGTNWTCR